MARYEYLEYVRQSRQCPDRTRSDVTLLKKVTLVVCSQIGKGVVNPSGAQCICTLHYFGRRPMLTHYHK